MNLDVEKKSEKNVESEKNENPKAIKFILLNIFFERFSTSGITGKCQNTIGLRISNQIRHF